MENVFSYKINPAPSADDYLVVATVTGTTEIPTRVKLEDMKVRSTLGTSYTLTQITDQAIDATNIDAGASGTGGSVDVFPATAAKGKLSIVATDSTGNTTTTVTNALQSAAAIMTIPDTNGNASFVMTAATQTIAGVKTFSSGIAFGAGATLDTDFAAVSASGNDTTQTATVTKATGTITTGALTTAAAGSTDVVLTLTGVVAGDPVFITKAGGTNTRTYEVFSAIATTNTITVTVRNVDLISALNGTVKFHYFWMKA